MTNPSMVWLDWPDANRGAIVFDEPPENEYQAGQTRYRRADLARGEDIARIAELEAALRLVNSRAADLLHCYRHGNGLDGWHKAADGLDAAVEKASAMLAARDGIE